MIDVFAILIGGLAHDEEGRMLNHAPKTSLLAALFFAAHPIHTESVSSMALTKALNKASSATQCALLLVHRKVDSTLKILLCQMSRTYRTHPMM